MIIEFDFKKRMISDGSDLTNWSEVECGPKSRLVCDSDSINKVELKTYIEVRENFICLSRSDSGEIPLFYSITGCILNISDSVSELRLAVGSCVNIDAAYTFIYSQFLPGKNTLFEGVFQVLNSQMIEFTYHDARINERIFDNFQLPKEEFTEYSEQNLTRELREKITDAHELRLGDSNALFLSGGLDSQVMAITLSKDLGLGSELEGLHFFVEGASQNELKEAKKVAKSLKIGFTCVGIDPIGDIDFDRMLSSNAPYIGSVSINVLLENSKLRENTTIFSGQDTRLHTPCMTGLDEQLMSLYDRPLFGKGVSSIARSILFFRRFVTNRFESRFYRNISFIANSESKKAFVTNRFFHTANLPFQSKSDKYSLIKEVSSEIGDVEATDKRGFYNSITEAWWRRQFIFDINYMSGTVSSNSFSPAMPFFDRNLTAFSSRLPYDLAAKMTKGRSGHGSKEIFVNKYLLRQAYMGDLDDALIYRDKAVCLTAHMFFNGGLIPVLDEFIDSKWVSRDEISLKLHLDDIRLLCQIKHRNWAEEDHWLLMIVFNALVVFKQLQA